MRRRVYMRIDRGQGKTDEFGRAWSEAFGLLKLVRELQISRTVRRLPDGSWRCLKGNPREASVPAAAVRPSDGVAGRGAPDNRTPRTSFSPGHVGRPGGGATGGSVTP